MTAGRRLGGWGTQAECWYASIWSESSRERVQRRLLGTGFVPRDGGARWRSGVQLAGRSFELSGQRRGCPEGKEA